MTEENKQQTTENIVRLGYQDLANIQDALNDFRAMIDNNVYKTHLSNTGLTDDEVSEQIEITKKSIEKFSGFIAEGLKPMVNVVEPDIVEANVVETDDVEYEPATAETTEKENS